MGSNHIKEGPAGVCPAEPPSTLAFPLGERWIFVKQGSHDAAVTCTFRRFYDENVTRLHHVQRMGGKRIGLGRLTPVTGRGRKKKAA